MHLLITGAWQQFYEFLPIIKRRHEVKLLQFEKDSLPCESDWIEGIIGNGFFLYHPIEHFVNLRFIQLTSAGYDRIPMDYVTSHNIKIFNARGVYSIPMAEYALSGVLSLLKNNRFFMEKQKSHLWEKDRNIKELFGRKICIFGCGSVGSECAKRFEAMGCEVIGIDPIVQENQYFDKVVHPMYMNSIVDESDVVIITLPLTKETKSMFNEEFFRVMKDGSIFVNIARGELVDTNALINALDAKLFGAVLDVFENEPLLPENALWDKPNLIITPHNSFVGDGNNNRLSHVIMSNLNEQN